MGYWDGIRRSGFVKLDDGRFAYFPFGVFGQGRIVSAERVAEIQRIQQRLLIPVFFIIPLSTALSWWCLLLAVPVIGWSIWWAKNALRDCEVVEGRRLGLRENAHSVAEAMGIWTVLLILLGSAVFVGLGLWLIMKPDEPLLARGIGALSVIFFGFGLWMFMDQLLHLVAKRKR
jgi:hypothetical protein